MSAFEGELDPLARRAAEALAKRFHEVYEELAPKFNYKTRKRSAVPWDQVPEDNKKLMVAVAATTLYERKAALGSE